MGYFDGIVDASFKKDSQGKDLFFPWGILGKGYILETEEKKIAIRGVLKKMYMILLPAIVLVQVILGVKYNLFILVIYIVWFLWWVNATTKGLARSNEKLKVSESYKNSARSHNLWILVLLELSSLMFVFMGVVILFSGNAPIVGGAAVGFFGFCAIAIGFMIAAKLKAKKTSGE